MPTAIILNGTSSAGKSSISKCLQQELEDWFLHFEMDAFWNMVPPDVHEDTKNFPHIKIAIAVKAPLDVLQKREDQRGDRTPGLSASQFPLIYQWPHYDLEIDTSELTPQAATEKIISHFNLRKKST